MVTRRGLNSKYRGKQLKISERMKRDVEELAKNYGVTESYVVEWAYWAGRKALVDHLVELREQKLRRKGMIDIPETEVVSLREESTEERLIRRVLFNFDDDLVWERVG